MNTTLRSPLPWIGGKAYSAQRIVATFPYHTSYDVFVDLFGGAANVLITKPRYKHLEIYNDINGDLVNFWMQCRDNVATLEEHCRSLPYARSLYYAYHKSLFDGTKMDALERAVRWFYMVRSSFTGWERESPTGWSAGRKDVNHASAHAYHSAIDLLKVLQQRFKHVLIDCRDFAEVLAQYHKRRMLIYGDPPYIGDEHYYNQPFAVEDHQHLAALLNETDAYVALSYYPHPMLETLYPASKWQRVTWATFKHSQRTKDTHDTAIEMLLCNYPPTTRELWTEEVAG